MMSLKKLFLLAIMIGQMMVAMGQPINLDPIFPTVPDARSVATGNWGYNALGIGKFRAEIVQRAERVVVVVIFDTGGEYTHPGLAKAAWNEMGHTFTGELPADGNGHSTHVAGTYAGQGQSGEVVGICDALLEKSLIKLVPAKVLSNGGSGSFQGNIDPALDYYLPFAKEWIAKGWGVVYSFSLGASTGGAVVESTESRLAEAKRAGVFIAAASGNSGNTDVIYPACGPAAHGVGALTQASDGSLTKASFSSYGPEVYNATPGQDIYSTWPPNQYRNASGTSMATPHEGAIAGLLLSIYKDATADDIAAHMAKWATDLGDTGKDDLYGWGVPYIEALLRNAPGDGTPGPGCRLDAPQITTICNNNGTPTDPADDVYNYTIKVTGQNTGKSYSILEAGGGIRQRLAYNQVNGPFGPFKISAGSIALAIQDDDQQTCGINSTAIAPAPCSTPVPPDQPVRTQEVYINKTYTVPFNTLDNPKNQQLKFRITVAYTHKLGTVAAVDQLVKITDEHFRGRGYTLLKNSDQWEAAYWVAFFYELIIKKDLALNVKVKKMIIELPGAGQIERVDFAKPSQISQKKATIKGAITYK